MVVLRAVFRATEEEAIISFTVPTCGNFFKHGMTKFAYHYNVLVLRLSESPATRPKWTRRLSGYAEKTVLMKSLRLVRCPAS